MNLHVRLCWATLCCMGLCALPGSRLRAQATKAPAFQSAVHYRVDYDLQTAALNPMWGDSVTLHYTPQGLYGQFYPDSVAPSTPGYGPLLRHMWLMNEEKRVYWQYAHSDTLYWAWGKENRYLLYGMSLNKAGDTLLGQPTHTLHLAKRAPSLPLDLLVRVTYAYAPALQLPVGYFAPFIGLLWNIYSRKAASVFLSYRVAFWEEDRYMHWWARRLDGPGSPPTPLPKQAPRLHDPLTQVLF